MTNGEIVDSFLKHKPATGPVSTNGKEILSYGVQIAVWKEDGIVMPNSSDGDKSITRCRNLVRQRALNAGVKVTQN